MPRGGTAVALRDEQRRLPMLNKIVLALVLTASVTHPAWAQTPDNDLAVHATAISNLPYTDVRDVRTATTDDDDLRCVRTGLAVFYTFRPSRDMTIEANTFGSNYDTTLAVALVNGGTATPIACNDDDAYEQVLQS